MSSFTDELNAEIDRRIAVMESPDYEPVAEFTARDFIPPSVIFAISLLIILICFANA